MKKSLIRIYWPNNIETEANAGNDWFINAKKTNFEIPKVCLLGSCGACEIDANGKTIRPCIDNIESTQKSITIDFANDIYWN